MPECRHHKICGRDALENSGEDLCILHSEDPAKDLVAFARALSEHRQKNGNDFSYFVFPGYTDFSDATFTRGANFSYATFTGGANFDKATFAGTAKFDGAIFNKWAEFIWAKFTYGTYFATTEFRGRAKFDGATFDNWADFGGAEFTEGADFVTTGFGGGANFRGATFTKEAYFGRGTFSESADFGVATFSAGANFYATVFTQGTNFSNATFLGRTIFASRQEGRHTVPIFWGAEVDFRDAIIDPPDALTFRDADLRKCRFQGTDLRKAEITGAKWAEIPGRTWLGIGRRDGVYDEVVLPDDETRSWAHVERVYRELKQNFEDRRDYGRAGVFHYGEKEARRKNSDTSWGLWFWLTLYKWVSGYGERWFPPLLWTVVVLVASTLCYLQLGLLRIKKAGIIADYSDAWETGLYSLKVMTLLKPTNFEPIGFGGDLVNTAQSLLGPILIGLFALALRQQLKR